MHMLFLGSGNAFTTTNYQSNILIESDGKKLLYDCGSDIRLSLEKHGYTYKDIDSVLISHLHSDHIGGLEWLAFKSYFDPDCPKPILHVSGYHDGRIWDYSLRGGLEYTYDINTKQVLHMKLNDYFEVSTYKDNKNIAISPSLNIRPRRMSHFADNLVSIPSFGIHLKAGNKLIFISGDSIFQTQDWKYYHVADCIFQDCETSPHATGFHARLVDLLTMPEEIRRKTWLYHHNELNDKHLQIAHRAGFLGFVKPGQTFDF